MKVEYNSNEITARVIKYYDNILSEDNALQATGSIEPDKYPIGVTLINTFGTLDDPGSKIPGGCKYGTVVHINDSVVDGSVEILIPYTPTNEPNTAKSIYVRTRTDKFVTKQQGWSEWRRLVYDDEIESSVLEILRAKGLIT